MPVSMEQVVKFLDRDEPDYDSALKLGAGALPHLKVLSDGPDLGLALKAVHLATLIGGGNSADIVNDAASRSNPLFRVVAAAALKRLPPQGVADIAPRLLSDPDAGVRRRAVASLPSGDNAALSDRLHELADQLPEGAHRADVIEAIKKVSP